MSGNTISGLCRGCIALTVLWLCAGIPGCSLVAPIFPCLGTLLDAATLQPLAGVDVYIDSWQPYEADPNVPLQGAALQAWLDQTAATTSAHAYGYCITEANGQFEAGIPGPVPTPNGWVNMFLPPSTVDVVYVYAKIGSVWRSIEVPLTEADQEQILDQGRRQIFLPPIYVTTNGLSLTPNP